MGDRCYMQITCREADAHLFDEDLFSDSEKLKGGLVRMWDHEANNAYDLYDGEFGDLPEGVPFYGSHEHGDEYGAASFATDGVTMRYALTNDDLYAVRFDENGDPNPKDLAGIKSYILFERQVYESLHGKEAAA